MQTFKGIVDIYAIPIKNSLVELKDYIMNRPPAVTIEDVYPVGSIYISMLDAATNPSELFGFGTWVQIAGGRSLLGGGGSYPIGQTGGATTHTLSLAEMASHTHSYSWISGSSWGRESGSGRGYASAYTNYQGGGGSHNNMPPYKSMIMWQRTA